MPLAQSQDYGKWSAISVRELLQFRKILLEIAFCEGFCPAHWVNSYTFPVAAVQTIEKVFGLSLSAARLEILRLKKCALTMTRKKA